MTGLPVRGPSTCGRSAAGCTPGDQAHHCERSRHAIEICAREGEHMTTKTARCLAQERTVWRTPSRHVTDGAPRHSGLIGMIDQPWAVRVGRTSVLIRGARPRDLAEVAAMHGRCSPQSILNRYRAGGRRPAVAALQLQLRQPLSLVATTYDGAVVATAVAEADGLHGRDAAAAGLLVEDAWQGQGL